MHACMCCTRAHTRASHTCAHTSACIYASTNTRRLSRVTSLPVCIRTRTRTHAHTRTHARARTHTHTHIPRWPTSDTHTHGHTLDKKAMMGRGSTWASTKTRTSVVAAAATSASHSADSRSAAGSLVAADADPSAAAASTGAPAAVSRAGVESCAGIAEGVAPPVFRLGVNDGFCLRCPSGPTGGVGISPARPLCVLWLDASDRPPGPVRWIG